MENGKSGWWIVPYSSNTRVIFITCPNKHTSVIGDQHEIMSNGWVYPELVCPHCEFNSLVVLEDWKYD